MVRFGAKKEEFIPPFLFYLNLKQKKEGIEPSLYFLKMLIHACFAYTALTASQFTTLKNAAI
jgi:hypothetical protein